MPSVVLVHGVRSSRTMWRPQIEALETSGFQVIAPDLPGHGARHDERFDLRSAITTIDTAVASCNEPPLVVGLSLGGFLTMHYAATTSRTLRGLILSGCTVVPNRWLTRAFGLYLSFRDHLPGDADASVTARFAKANTPEAALHYYGGGRAASHVVGPVMREIGRVDVIGALHAIRIPVTLVNGERDEFRLHEKRCVAAASDARLVIIPGAGHISNLNAPARFTNEIRDAWTHSATPVQDRAPDQASTPDATALQLAH